MARLVGINDIVGAVAHRAVTLHPYGEPPDLYVVTKRLRDAAMAQFTDGFPSVGFYARRFENWRALRTWINTTLIENETSARVLQAWNTPRSGHTDNVSVSAVDRPRVEDDFIDIDALVMEAGNMAWDACFSYETKPDEMTTQEAIPESVQDLPDAPDVPLYPYDKGVVFPDGTKLKFTSATYLTMSTSQGLLFELGYDGSYKLGPAMPTAEDAKAFFNALFEHYPGLLKARKNELGLTDADLPRSAED